MKKGGTRSGKVAMPEPQEEEDKYGIAEETPFYCDGNSPHTLLKK
jgi:hypothetical protein